jgi:hypothetical protein
MTGEYDNVVLGTKHEGPLYTSFTWSEWSSFKGAQVEGTP